MFLNTQPDNISSSVVVGNPSPGSRPNSFSTLTRSLKWGVDTSIKTTSDNASSWWTLPGGKWKKSPGPNSRCSKEPSSASKRSKIWPERTKAASSFNLWYWRPPWLNDFQAIRTQTYQSHGHLLEKTFKPCQAKKLIWKPQTRWRQKPRACPPHKEQQVKWFQ